eukprot:12003354-Karenia_brevis.AAC.1
MHGPSQWQVAMQDIYAKYALARNLAKSEEAELVFKAWGATVDGITGIFSAGSSKLTKLAFALASILVKLAATEADLRHVVGSFCFAALFNRLLYSIMQEVFPFIEEQAGAAAGRAVPMGPK